MKANAALTQVLICNTAEVDFIIDSKVQKKTSARQMSYRDALLEVSREEPALFEWKRNMLLGHNEAIRFDFVNGQLVNPTVYRDGTAVSVDPTGYYLTQSVVKPTAIDPFGDKPIQDVAIDVFKTDLAPELAKKLLASASIPNTRRFCARD